MYKHILFVCTGNICRSPMAAGLLASRVLDDSGCVVESAGTHGIDGQPAEPLAVEIMLERGVDLSGHRARTVNPVLLREVDLILTMEAAQQLWIQKKMPSVGYRVHTLNRRGRPDIQDPMGGTRADFERAFKEIEKCLADWSPELLPQYERA